MSRAVVWQYSVPGGGLMGPDLISGNTRLAFREYFVGTTLSTIADAFEAAGIRCATDYDPPVSGQRRTLVEQFYRTLDFTRWNDVRKLVSVYERVLDDLEIQAGTESSFQTPYSTQELDKLLRCLRRDGFTWEDGRLIAPPDMITISTVHDAIAGLDAPELNRQIGRLRDSVNDDPGLAVGTAKEMLETTCKTILEDCGVEVDAGWDVGELLKRTRKELKLLPDDISAAAKGAETIKRLLNNLGQVGIGLSELRNLYGSGHGRSGRAKGLAPRHARLAVGAVSTLVLFLFEAHQERRELGGLRDATERSRSS